jgi:hypothetical protein
MRYLVLLLTVSCAAVQKPAVQEKPACSDAELMAIVADCKALEEDNQCVGQAEVKCPEIVKECDKRIDAWKDCK